MADTISIGNAGVQKVIARISVACHANVRQGSYSEDSMKCDILFTFKNAFDADELCELAGQVKTGNSFIKVNITQTTARIDNCSDVKKIIVKSGIPLIIFVVVDEKNVHWYSGDVRSKTIETINIPITQIIAPSIWIDFSRLYRYWQYQRDNYLTQSMSSKIFDKEMMAGCKATFKEIQSKQFTNPVIGYIDVTKKSWEHITRAGRKKIARQNSIRATKHLRHFLETNPDRIGLKNVKRIIKGEIVQETRELMMYYRRGISFNNEIYTFAVRVDEIIEYPKDWVELTLTTDQVKHKRKLASWWIKKGA